MPTLSIDPALKLKCPRTALGFLSMRVAVRETPQALLQEMNLRETEILKLKEPQSILESPKILATRAGYKALGKDPARYRGSAEALIRRIIAGKGFPQINNVVDIINLVAVESRLPVGLYDLGQVKGDMVFRAGRAGESYKGIGKYDLNLEGLPIFCDESGPYGSPTSDSERTMVTNETQHIAAIVISFGGAEGLESSCQHMAMLLQKHAAGYDSHVEIRW